MSRENVELVRKLQFERLPEDFRDAERNAEWFELADPDIEWDLRGMRGSGIVGPRLYRGHEGVRAFWRDWLQAWEEVRFRYEEFIEAGDEVVVKVMQHARGRASGVEVELGPYAVLWTLREGLAVRMRMFSDWREGLAAAGIEPS